MGRVKDPSGGLRRFPAPRASPKTGCDARPPRELSPRPRDHGDRGDRGIRDGLGVRRGAANVAEHAGLAAGHRLRSLRRHPALSRVREPEVPRDGEGPGGRRRSQGGNRGGGHEEAHDRERAGIVRRGAAARRKFVPAPAHGRDRLRAAPRAHRLGETDDRSDDVHPRPRHDRPRRRRGAGRARGKRGQRAGDPRRGRLRTIAARGGGDPGQGGGGGPLVHAALALADPGSHQPAQSPEADGGRRRTRVRRRHEPGERVHGATAGGRTGEGAALARRRRGDERSHRRW
jgi:hypothetical protein